MAGFVESIYRHPYKEVLPAMEDEKIIDLYWERKDEAIMETQAAYGRQLQTIAQRIVQSYEDAAATPSDAIVGELFDSMQREVHEETNIPYDLVSKMSMTGVLQ